MKKLYLYSAKLITEIIIDWIIIYCLHFIPWARISFIYTFELTTIILSCVIGYLFLRLVLKVNKTKDWIINRIVFILLNAVLVILSSFFIQGNLGFEILYCMEMLSLSQIILLLLVIISSIIFSAKKNNG